MKESDLTKAEVEAIHKVVWLMNEYPGKTINEFASTFLVARQDYFTVPGMCTFDINTAIYRAVDLGYVVIDDPEFDGTGTYKVDQVPKIWQLGEVVESLTKAIPYVIGKLNDEEGDIMDAQLQKWFAPTYNGYDYAIALKQLLNDRVIVDYQLTNVNIIEPSKKGKKRGKKAEEIRDTYTFYTLFENLEQRWGIKQFPDQSRVE